MPTTYLLGLLWQGHLCPDSCSKAWQQSTQWHGLRPVEVKILQKILLSILQLKVERIITNAHLLLVDTAKKKEDKIASSKPRDTLIFTTYLFWSCQLVQVSVKPLQKVVCNQHLINMTQRKKSVPRMTMTRQNFNVLCMCSAQTCARPL